MDVYRSNMPLKLGNSPLVLALGQVRIGAVLRMEDYIPDVQERLRHAGYPRFNQAQTQEIRFDPSLTGQPQMSTSTKWLFADRDNATAVVVAPDFVVLETVAYDTFDIFVDRFAAALAVVGEVAKVDLVERVGLRYVDVIQPTLEDRLDDYLAPGIQGLLLPGVDLTAVRGRYILEGKTAAESTLRVRLTRGQGRVPTPLDLQQPDLPWRKLKEEGEYALLDFDHFQTGTMGYATESLVELLWNLHDPVDVAFRAATTDLARERWDAKPTGEG